MFVNQLIASSIHIIQIDSKHMLSYHMPISLVYYYTGVFCDIWRVFVYWLPRPLFFICFFNFTNIPAAWRAYVYVPSRYWKIDRYSTQDLDKKYNYTDTDT